MTKIIKRVVPAMLTESPAALVSMLRQAEFFTDWVQIDIMDGLFVPPVSVTSQDIARIGVKIDWEAHLMVKDPEKYLEDFHLAGAKRIVVHYEAVKDSASDIIEHITSLGMGASLAVNPETPLEMLEDNLVSHLESVLFLAVHPGYYGARFIPEVLDKIRQFSRLRPDISIGIDGGVKTDNIIQVVESGVNEICVGSAIFAQPDPAASFRELNALARIGWEKKTSV